MQALGIAIPLALTITVALMVWVVWELALTTLLDIVWRMSLATDAQALRLRRMLRAAWAAATFAAMLVIILVLASLCTTD